MISRNICNGVIYLSKQAHLKSVGVLLKFRELTSPDVLLRLTAKQLQQPLNPAVDSGRLAASWQILAWIGPALVVPQAITPPTAPP